VKGLFDVFDCSRITVYGVKCYCCKACLPLTMHSCTES